VYGIFDEVRYMIAITTAMSPDNIPPSILHTTLNLKWGVSLKNMPPQTCGCRWNQTMTWL